MLFQSAFQSFSDAFIGLGVVLCGKMERERDPQKFKRSIREGTGRMEMSAGLM